MTITQSSTRFVAVAAGLALAISLFAVGFAPAQAAGLSQTQIQSILSLLSSFGADQATINNVNAALNGQATGGTGGSTGGTCPVLSRSLQVGSDGADVKSLQVFLNSSATTQVASAGAGSPGNESTYFGGLTKAAVIKFQSANGVSPIGIVGPATRAAIAAVCGNTGGGNTGGGNTGGGTGTVTVSASSQPANSLAVASAARVPFTTFTLTNNSGAPVTISSVTVQRTGLGVDANFSGVVLLDSNGLQIGNAKTFNSNHQANIGDSGFTLQAGQSMTYTVAGNMANSSTVQTGQVVSIQVVAVNTTGAAVSGSLPIMGASQTINNTLTLGAFSTSTSSVISKTGTSHTQNVGDTGVRFAGVKFTANSAEDLKLYSIRWRQIGSASNVDISNVTTVASGTTYPTTVDSTGKYYTTVFPGGLMIAKGNSIDVYVQGDITGSNSASRTVQFTIDRATDVYFVGQLYGYGIADAVYPNAQPWYQGDSFTISAGSASTISKSTAAADAAQNIATNVNNQPLGGFTTNFLGEPVTVSGMTLSVASSSGAGLLTSVSITDDNGAVVAGPVDGTVQGTSLVFSDSVTFPTGLHTYHVKGKVGSTAVNGKTITLTVTPSNWTNPTGQVTGSNITIGNSAFALNQMTVRGATTSITMSSSPSAQSIVAGAQGFTFANIQVDASQSGEDVRMNSLPLTLSGTNAATDLSGCQIYDGSTALTTGSRVQNSLSAGTVTFSFDNSLVIPKGTIKTLSVVCNLSSSAAGSDTVQWTLLGGSNYSANGVTSGTSITPSVASLTASGLMTVASGSASLAVDSSSPSIQVAAGGQTGVTAGVYKFRATNEQLNLTKLGLTLTTTSGSGNKASDLTNVYIYNGSTLVGTASFTGSNTTATSTLSTPVSLTKDVDTLITIKADIADIGTSQPGTEGDLVKIDPLNFEATGASSGNTVSGPTATSSVSGNVAGIRIFNTFPSFALDSLSTSGVNSGQLMRFKVTADSHGTVGINKFTFTLSTTTLSVSTVGLYGYTDATYSTPISDNVAAGGVSSGGQIDGNLATSTMANCTTTAGSSCSNNGSVTTLKFVTATNAIEVPAGQTRYFELRGSIAGATSGANVVTTLLSDSTMATGTASTLIGSYNFVWSPNATSTQAITGDNDWANGYLPSAGLPTAGLIQTRSN